MNNSPFFIIDNFISPLNCEDIIDRLNHTFPNYNKEQKPIKTVKSNILTQTRITPLLEDMIPELESKYGHQHKGILPFDFEWFVPGVVLEPPKCSNSVYKNDKWQRINDYDFTGIIFLNEYQDGVPFDPFFEVYGGKLEFVNQGFGINPKRGTLVIFPGGPHFSNYTSEIKAGELNQIRFNMVATKNYEYDPNMFPGNYKTWFT